MTTMQTTGTSTATAPCEIAEMDEGRADCRNPTKYVVWNDMKAYRVCGTHLNHAVESMASPTERTVHVELF